MMYLFFFKLQKYSHPNTNISLIKSICKSTLHPTFVTQLFPTRYATSNVFDYNRFSIKGDGINQTIVTGNHSHGDRWSTYSSSTFAVTARGFVAKDMMFRNRAGAIKQQAVAVRNEANLSTFYRCSFVGYQYTLYVYLGKQFFRECDIYGTIDFIFGYAAVVFQNCNIYLRLPMSGQSNTIIAQGRNSSDENTGISVHNCTIRAATDLANNNRTFRTYLSRPWREYSVTVFMQSFMDTLVNPAGWTTWDGALKTPYYAEFNNSGPGSNTSQRVTWPGFHIMNEWDAINFTVSRFLSGDNWIPKTGCHTRPVYCSSCFMTP